MSARVFWFILVCLAVGGLWYVDPGRTYVAPPPPPPKTIIDLSPEELRRDLFLFTKRPVQNVLLAPTTATFPHSWESGHLERAGAGAEHRYRLSAYVDSQNAFGAMLRQPYAVTVHYRCYDFQTYTWDCWTVQRVQVGSQVYQAAR